MGIWKSFFDLFKKNAEVDLSYDFDALVDEYNSLYLKHLAIDVNAEFLARIFSSSEFRLMDKDQRIQNQWTYMMNVRPNKDQSASSFWQNFIYKLIIKNEVLVVLSDDDQLLIADSYIRNEYALFDDTFESVCIREFEYKRKFKMSEVIYLNYNNNNLKRYVDGLYEDYYSLYQRMIEVAMRNHQVRSIVKGKDGRGFDDELQKKAQTYIDKVMNKFNKESIAIVPLQDGLEYEELTNKMGETDQSIDEMRKLKRQFTDEVSDIIGIPTSIIHGEMADLESSQKVLSLYTLKSLYKKVEDELNAKIITLSDYTSGKHWKIIGVDKRDIFDLASSIDKLVSSGSFNRNEVRKEVDYERVDGLDEFVITKNYTKSEGGEEINGTEKD